MAVSSNTVLGKYRIIREIARSNDIVYEALDPAMARRVAVKELQIPPHLAGAQKRERIERFYREAKAAGTLSHRNIVTIFDVGQENDRHFLVMEYLEGQSLRDILQMQGALPLKETVEITLQLCDALAYAHSRGVVHRDIKPDNVHILPGGVIKLTDFGIARITAEPSITSQGQVFGTPSYMSPEQVASHTVDHRTDLFSLGITLYEMLTGRKPFVGDSVITITYNIMNIQPTMPVGVPAALQQILQRALAKDPGLRYQNAAQMAADLRAEKFALSAPGQTASAAHVPKTPPLTFAGPPLTLETGSVPPEISGMPAPSPLASAHTPPRTSAGMEPTQALHTPSESPARRARRLTASQDKMLAKALPVLALLVLLGLAAWGLRTIVVSVTAHNRRGQAETLLKQAASDLAQGRPAEAARVYAHAAEIAPAGTTEADEAAQGQAQAQTAQGLALAQKSDLTGANQALEKAVLLNRRSAAAWNALGSVRWQSGDSSGALTAWEGAVSADADSVSGREAKQNAVGHAMDMARSAADGHRLAEARQLWQRVQALSPGSDAASRASQNLSRTADADVSSGVGLPR